MAKRYSQPQTPVKADPRFSHVWLPSQGMRDMVGTAHASGFGSSVGQKGVELLINDTYPNCSIPSTDIGSTFTEIVVAKINSLAVPLLFGVAGASFSSGGYTLVLSSGVFYTSCNGGSNTSFTGATVPAAGEWVVFVVRRQSGAVPSLFINGKKYSGAASVTGGLVADRISSGAARGYSSTALIATTQTLLTDAEIKSLSDNPWAIFQPVNRPIFVPVAGGSPDGNAIGALASVSLTPATGGAAGTGATIASTDQTASRIYQRAAGGTTKTITFSGTYTGVDPASIEVQIVNVAGGGVAQAYTALSSAAIGSGAWSGTLSVPQGGWYNFVSRSKDGGGTVLATATQSSNSWGVGVLLACIGQSNMFYMFANSYLPPTADDLTKRYDSGGWAAPIGNGAIWLANLLRATLNVPVGLLNYAVSGTGLYAGFGGAYWLETSAGKPYPLFKVGLDATGGDCEYAIWYQGEADAQASVTKAQYKGALDTLFTTLKTDTGRASLKFGSYLMGRATGPATATWDAIRQAHLEWTRDTAGAFNAGSAVDMPLGDVVHWTTVGTQRMARRTAQAVLHQAGLVAFGASGPKVTSAVRPSASAVITMPVTHDAGSGLTELDASTDGGSLTGFEVSNDDFATNLTVSSTAYSGASVLVTLASVPSGTVKVRYQYGVSPDVTNPVYDNTVPQSDTIGLPLQPTNGAVTVTEFADANASGSLATITLTPSTGSAVGTGAGAGSASGALAVLTLTAASGTGTGTAFVVGSVREINVSAPTGAASSFTPGEYVPGARAGGSGFKSTVRPSRIATTTR